MESNTPVAELESARSVWEGMTLAEQEAVLKEHPHVPFLAIAQYYWGRGATQEEAVKRLREAGFSGRTKGRVTLYVFPAGLLDPSVDSMGRVGFFRHPLLGQTGMPQKVKL